MQKRVLQFLTPFSFEVVTMSALLFGAAHLVSIPIDKEKLHFILILGPLCIAIAHASGQTAYVLIASKISNNTLLWEWLSRYVSAQLMLPLVWAILGCIFYVVREPEIIGLPQNGVEVLGGLGLIFTAALPGILTFISRVEISIAEKPFLHSVKVILQRLAILVSFMVLFSASCFIAYRYIGGFFQQVSNSIKYYGCSIEYVFIDGVYELAKNCIENRDSLMPLIPLVIMAATLIMAMAISRMVSINLISAHDIYRNRLVRTFLGGANKNRMPHPFTDFGPNDDKSLADLKTKEANMTPLWIINCALNIGPAVELAWQERRSLPFTFSCIAAGSTILGANRFGEIGTATSSGVFRCADEYAAGRNRDNPVTVGEAIAVSGAAFNTTMGSFSSPFLTMISTILNARLGVWWGNPASNNSYKNKDPKLAIQPMASEWLGTNADDQEYISLSDGGHFDNLGLYEMLMRECNKILVVDAGCDPECLLEDLGKAVRMAQLDKEGGLEVEFLPGQLDRLRSLAVKFATEEDKERFPIAEAKITYYKSDDGKKLEGKLIYVKPTLISKMKPEVLSYASRNNRFPHESTTDQWFGGKPNDGVYSPRRTNRFKNSSLMLPLQTDLNHPIQVIET